MSKGNKSDRRTKKSDKRTANELLSEILRDNPEARESLARALRQARDGQFMALEELLKSAEES